MKIKVILEKQMIHIHIKSQICVVIIMEGVD